MTQRLFFNDDAVSCEVEVIHCAPQEDGFAVILYATPFHPQGGGQPSDTGWIGDSEVIKVVQGQDAIVHHVSVPVPTGRARAQVDETRRRLHARLHSAGHLIGVCGEQLGWVPTKAHHWPGECRVSFVASDNPQPLEAEAVQHTLAQWIAADLQRHTCLDSEQRAIRFGELPGYPCGGTHVQSLAELGTVNVLSVSQKKGVLSVRYALD
ncbi:hypothetical protein [Pseudomonas fragi]|uniref:hypothetical protein n=1 Tax=Pseudomonas fragi TaxID=296 RepID=UPI000BA1E2BF|nr:hypothetical protein [Pseudomonas fragi]PAA11171.1 hypothetical protein CJU74_22180 [Pseudomonas fragi]